MKIEIRQATIKDFGDIQQLNHKLFEKEYEEYDKTLDCGWPFSKKGIKYFKDVISRKDCAAFVAIKDKKIVGYLAGSIEKAPIGRKKNKFAELGNMFIPEQYRNQGIGTMLCQEFINWCKKNRVSIINVKASTLNEDAIKFYIKNGFDKYELILKKEL